MIADSKSAVLNGSTHVEEELPPSKLGTKAHWDEVYEREVRVFNDVGDEGEVWFGESSVRKMRKWAHSNLNLPTLTTKPSTSSHPHPSSSTGVPLRILECGSGNGTLLLSFLTSPSGPPRQFQLTGIDYSPLAIDLAKGVEAATRASLADGTYESDSDSDGDEDEDEDEEDGPAGADAGAVEGSKGRVINNVPNIDWRVGDLLRDEIDEQWDLVLDKGTFDALALSNIPLEPPSSSTTSTTSLPTASAKLTPGDVDDSRLPSRVYPERVARLVKDGGFFLITSCNFTEEEIKRRWTRDGLGFEFHSSVPHPTYTFGGRSGSVVCTVAFRKVSTVPTSSSITTTTTSHEPNRTINPTVAVVDGQQQSAKANNEKPDMAVGSRQSARHESKARNGAVTNDTTQDLYVCIDAGGTKTDVAIVSRQGIVARAAGGTGNMAEVGAQNCYEVISSTVLEAIKTLPDGHRPSSPSSEESGSELKVCPVQFADVWVGISGCDTPLDQQRMSALLSPFFGIPEISILNDAHLLGGVLLTHHCPWGIAVIAGTGSIVVSLEVGKDGAVEQTGRRGGFGYLLGDDGSAFDLGRCAIRAAADAFDAGEEDINGLAGVMKTHFGVNSTGEILGKVHELDPTLSPLESMNNRKLQISSLARSVIEYFTRRPTPDPIAVMAVQEATRPLIKSIVSLVRQNEATVSELTGLPRVTPPAALIMGGGLIRQPSYRHVIISTLAQDHGIKFGVEQVVEDVAGEGALGLMARARSESESG